MDDPGFGLLETQSRAFRLAHAILMARYAEHLPADRLQTDLLVDEVLPAIERVQAGIGLDTRAEATPPALVRRLLEPGGWSVPRSPAEVLAAEVEGRRDLLRARRPLDRGAGTVLLAANHARVVFAVIPRIPHVLATWPRPRLGTGYLDVAAPTDLETTFDRVRELERVLVRLAGARPMDLDEPLRRAWAFCETAARLDLVLRASIGPGI